ncbi:MAG: transglutaminase family protein [Verrucomicrobia bacterium]|nr:transglutaminase family protein [Verrucomicrobiota bacterium]
MFKQRDAIIRLLQDDDPDTVTLTKKQLATGGTEIISDLKDLLSTDDEKVAFHVRDILSSIEGRSAKTAFEDVCRNISATADLERGCWYLAKVFLPGLEIQKYMDIVNDWGQELQSRTARLDSAPARVLAMAHFLGRDLGLRGNADNYYNVNNSLLPCVIDSRLGIPISLSVLYMIVASRAKIVVDGINLPGHFVVRHGDILFDPFHEGRVLSSRDCAEILSQQKLSLQPSHLQSAPPRLVLMRILGNLLHIFEEDDESLHQTIAKWIHLLEHQ